MRNTFRRMTALICMLMALCVGCAGAEAPATPTPTPVPTPSAEDLGKLEIQIVGPTEEEEPRLNTIIPYSEFTDGKYTLGELVPGTYTVTEVDPDKLLEGLNYTYDTDNSVQTLTIEVKAEETASVEPLKNIYERPATPSPTPEVTETPTPTPVPDDELTSITVVKRWDDRNNRDGNRPDRVTVHLLADGVRTAQAVLTAASGWQYEFTELPKYKDGHVIAYTIVEEPVAMYSATVDGNTITNVYAPETVSVTVSKVWADNNNAAKLRPATVQVTLSNGQKVTLSEANNWTATISGLPAVVKGKKVTYTWSEQEVVGYKQAGVQVSGNTTVFTNSVIDREENPPPEGRKPPTKKRGNNYLVIEDYGTPLGVEVVINHVGDCFD